MAPGARRRVRAQRARQASFRGMPRPWADEYQFTRDVIKEATARGWKVVRVPRMKGTSGGWHTPSTLPGWPDLLLFKPPRLICLELKMPGNKPTEAQAEILAELAGCVLPVEAYPVWPRDWDEILTMLDETPPPALVEAHRRIDQLTDDQLAAFLRWSDPSYTAPQ